MCEPTEDVLTVQQRTMDNFSNLCPKILYRFLVLIATSFEVWQKFYLALFIGNKNNHSNLDFKKLGWNCDIWFKKSLVSLWTKISKHDFSAARCSASAQLSAQVLSSAQSYFKPSKEPRLGVYLKLVPLGVCKALWSRLDISVGEANTQPFPENQ